MAFNRVYYIDIILLIMPLVNPPRLMYPQRASAPYGAKKAPPRKNGTALWIWNCQNQIFFVCSVSAIGFIVKQRSMTFGSPRVHRSILPLPYPFFLRNAKSLSKRNVTGMPITAARI